MLNPIRRPNAIDIARLLLVGAIWGGAFVFISLALNDFGPASIAGWRLFLATVILIIIALAIGESFPRGARNWRLIIVVGFLYCALPFFLIAWGQQFISSAESAVLMAMATFCTLIVSHFTSHDERINRYRVIGVIVGFVGVLVLVLWDLIASGPGRLSGQLAVIVAGCSYSLSSIISRRLTHLPSISTSAASMASSCVYMLPLAFWLEEPLSVDATSQSILSLAYLGIIATAFAFTLRFLIIRTNGAVFMSLVGYLVPLFGVVWSGLYFAETINLQTLIALSLILLGIAITRRGS